MLRMQRSVTKCKISFLLVVLELSAGVFNNSVLAALGDLLGSVQQLVWTLTHSASQGGGGGACAASCRLFLQLEGHHLC